MGILDYGEIAVALKQYNSQILPIFSWNAGFNAKLWIHSWPFEDIIMMVMPGQDKEKQKWSEDWGKKTGMEKKIVCIRTIQSSNFYRCFLFAWDSLLLMLFLMFLFSCAFLHQLCSKIFLCVHANPHIFLDLVQWKNSFFPLRVKTHQYSSYSLSRPMENVLLRLNRPE